LEGDGINLLKKLWYFVIWYKFCCYSDLGWALGNS
jgi:hypothetical protein